MEQPENVSKETWCKIWLNGDTFFHSWNVENSFIDIKPDEKQYSMKMLAVGRTAYIETTTFLCNAPFVSIESHTELLIDYKFENTSC